MGFDASYIWDSFPALVKYLPITLLLAVVSMFFAVLIGLVLAICRFNKIPVLNQLAAAYISFFRGVPTLVQLFLIYFGLPQIIPAMSSLDAMTAAIMGLSLKEASYLAEIFRAALTSVDRGQYEAGLSTRLKPRQIYQHYVLPQAAFNALPSTGNIFIGLIKETSIVFTLGITEMFASAQMVAANNFHYFETYLMAGLLYWAVIAIVGYLLELLEKSIGRPYQR
ncbi:amino acid ABC transporter permease [Propionimicrobium sp. PCR01-08-3]|uniref:amino acid ABC transporter permease n=1 Tax=Propionimicrobium sp. PCR01-08-3 TaxID=3052086 RepID=UPI00255CC12A|nr:amino acid ABC transporter permease [Propionimicrobium sp. PCR01-08-3]WIY82785.1 amino acid ABC transporter permease [Propionimicrobium sp. PCR01-08-3]